MEEKEKRKRKQKEKPTNQKTTIYPIPQESLHSLGRPNIGHAVTQLYSTCLEMSRDN